MGFLLLILGGLLVYGQFNGKSALDIILTWWPVIFFLLGAEVLFYSYLLKEEQPKLKYDFFSIFIILMLVLTGIGLYGLNQLGLTQRLSMMVNAQSYSMQTPVEEFKLEAAVKKIVITSPAQTRLKVRTATGSSLLAYGNAYITADSKEKAQGLLTEQRITTHQKDDTLYVAFNLPLNNGPLGYHARMTDFTLVIPQDRQVEIKGGHYGLELVVDNLNNNWLIETPSSLEVRLGANPDLAIEALVDHKDLLRGNVEWITVQNVKDGEAKRPGIQGRSTFGKGQYKLAVICGGEVTVKKI